MNDEDTDAGGDLFISLATVLIAIFLFIVAVSIIGGILWMLIA
jgi:hypothetical protein